MTQTSPDAQIEAKAREYAASVFEKRSCELGTVIDDAATDWAVGYRVGVEAAAKLADARAGYIGAHDIRALLSDGKGPGEA